MRGELDLRGWDLTTTHTLKLDGTWEFYPRALLMPSAGDAHTSGEEREFIKVPGDWSASLSPHTNSPFGYGTYRLHILVNPHKGQTYGIRLPIIMSSSELYVNGRLQAKSGQPDQSSERYTARIVPYSASFTADGGEIDIVIHVANFDDSHYGGIFQSVAFGSERAVNHETWFSIGLQLMLCVILMSHAFYAFILYLIGARQRGLITFAILMLIWITTVLVSDDMMLLVWAPINYEWAIKIFNLSYLGTSVFMLEFYKRLLPEYSTVRAFRWYTFLSAICALYILLAPAKYQWLLDNVHTIFILAPFVIVTVITFRTAMKGDSNAIFLLLGNAALMNNFIWAIPKEMGLVEMDFYPYDIIAFFFCFRMLLV